MAKLWKNADVEVDAVYLFVGHAKWRHHLQIAPAAGRSCNAQLQAIINKEAWQFNHSCSTAEVFRILELHDPEIEDFQNLTGSFLSKDTSLVNFCEDPISSF